MSNLPNRLGMCSSCYWFAAFHAFLAPLFSATTERQQKRQQMKAFIAAQSRYENDPSLKIDHIVSKDQRPSCKSRTAPPLNSCVQIAVSPKSILSWTFASYSEFSGSWYAFR